MNPDILNSPAGLPLNSSYVLAFGTFDGVHRGHQLLLQNLRQIASEQHAQTAVVFFDPLPKAVLNPQDPPAKLTSTDEKIRLLRQENIQQIIAFPFNQELAGLTPQEFLNQYIFPRQDNAPRFRAFCIGEDWRFGCRNSGTPETLRLEAAKFNLPVKTIPQLTYLNAPISSTRIRHAIAQGDLDNASRMLGRPVTLTGIVRPGLRLASTKLNCPTANLEVAGLQLPPEGVYAGSAVLDNTQTRCLAIAYLGTAPTIRGDNHQTLLEIHLLDYHGDLYGQPLHLELAKFLRPSKRFHSPQELADQIQMDIARCQEFLQN